MTGDRSVAPSLALAAELVGRRKAGAGTCRHVHPSVLRGWRRRSGGGIKRRLLRGEDFRTVTVVQHTAFEGAVLLLRVRTGSDIADRAR